MMINGVHGIQNGRPLSGPATPSNSSIWTSSSFLSPLLYTHIHSHNYTTTPSIMYQQPHMPQPGMMPAQQGMPNQLQFRKRPSEADPITKHIK